MFNKNNKVTNEALKKYLKEIQWDSTTYSNNTLQGMLVKSIIFYLDGKGDLDFVLQFAEEINKKQGKVMNRELKEATKILCNLTENIKNKTILPTDNDTIFNTIDDAQLVITRTSKK